MVIIIKVAAANMTSATDNENKVTASNCHKAFKVIPWELNSEALKTLNKQFHTYRADHIRAIENGRGAELQAVDKYHQNKKIAIHEAGHVMAAWYGGSRNVVFATIKYSWMYYHEPQYHIKPQRKNPLETQADLFEDLCFWLSGRIAESMFFPEEQAHFPYFINFEGSDIHKAINIAYYMSEIETGFTREDGNLRIPNNVLEDFSCYLIRAYQATTDLLKTRAKALQTVALKLLKHKSLKVNYLLGILGSPKKRTMSLYDQYCAFSMELRPLEKKRYCLTKPRRSKKIKKRKTRKSNASRRKKSKAAAKRSKKSQVSTLSQKKIKSTSKSSRKRKLNDDVHSIASKKRLTNSGQVISIFN